MAGAAASSHIVTLALSARRLGVSDLSTRAYLFSLYGYCAHLGCSALCWYYTLLCCSFGSSSLCTSISTLSFEHNMPEAPEIRAFAEQLEAAKAEYGKWHKGEVLKGE